jgi:hypothetical protein
MNVLLEVVLFFYKIFRRLSRCLVRMRGEATHVYLVTPNGEQVPLTDANYTAYAAFCLLVKFYTLQGVRYRFVEAPDMARSYTDLVPAKEKIMGLSVTVGRATYPLDADEFNVEGSTLFTPTFNAWMCRNLLSVPVEEVEATVIDADVNVSCTKNPLYLK